MPTLIITVDPQCCRCITKLQNILCCIHDRGEFVIDKISYEKDKALVSGPFDAEKLYCKLWCKAGKIIKGIEVAKPPKPEPDPPKCMCVCVCVCVCGSKPEPDPPKCMCVCVCVCGCPTPNCKCRSKPPSPPPAPPKPPTCVCLMWPSCHCCSYPPTRMPYPALLVCEESPPYDACAVM